METLLEKDTIYKPSLEAVKEASERISKVVLKTPLAESFTYSKRFDAKVMLKREDLQQVRSYKIRGAYNKISSLPQEQLENGVICASAGNHAQGVAFACNKLKVKGVIYMPGTTPQQKVEQTEMFGGEWVEVVLKGDTYDDSYKSAMVYMAEKGLIFIHPFDDEKVIEGTGSSRSKIEINSDYYSNIPHKNSSVSFFLREVQSQLDPSAQYLQPLARSTCYAFWNIQNE